jgi:hypothetical protein
LPALILIIRVSNASHVLSADFEFILIKNKGGYYMNIVKLYLNKDYSIHQLQETFSSMYPYLRINFYYEAAQRKSHAFQCSFFSPEVKMLDMNPSFRNGDLELGDEMQVVELEKKLLEQFGLHAQISRRSGNLWMETSKTNAWTLRQQNEHGKAISPEHNPINAIYYRDVPFGC